MIHQRVRVFKEIKSKRWTVYDLETKEHLGYFDELNLKDVEFFVDDKKRKHILKTKKRFPHAWVIGKMIKKNMTKNKREVIYHPLETELFQTKRGRNMLNSKYCHLSLDMKCFVE